MNMLIQVTLGNAILTAIGITFGVVMFVGLVLVWLYDELGDVLNTDHHKHKAHR